MLRGRTPIATVLGRKRDPAEHYSSLPRGMIHDKSLAMVRHEQVSRPRRLGFCLSASEEESNWIYREPEPFLKMRVATGRFGAVRISPLGRNLYLLAGS